MWLLFGSFLETLGLLFGSFLETLGLLFNPSFGHTENDTNLNILKAVFIEMFYWQVLAYKVYSDKGHVEIDKMQFVFESWFVVDSVPKSIVRTLYWKFVLKVNKDRVPTQVYHHTAQNQQFRTSIGIGTYRSASRIALYI